MQTSMFNSDRSSGVVWIKLAMIYLIVGISIGIGMGATQDFTLRPVHAHLNLLGWTSLALAGLVYAMYPQLAHSRLARLHFWLYNLALPPMMVALALVLTGRTAAVPVLVATEMMLAVGVLVFAANLFVNLKRTA